MSKSNFSAITAMVAVASFSLLFLRSSAAQKNYNEWTIAGYSKYKTIPGATRVGSDTCATCHAEIVSEASHAFHAQQGVQCEDCHGNGSLHVAGGGDVTKIISLKKRSPGEANGVCLSCHAQDERVRNWMTGKHSSNGVRCIDCHQIHGKTLRAINESRMNLDTATRAAFVAGSVSPETDVIVRKPAATNEACLKCHKTQAAQMSMPYHHPLREGKMSCADCHDPHGGAGGNNLRVANVNQLCLSCHAQYRGPFAYQHPPVTESCLLCHTPHGSPNTNLLTVSEPALCLQCHAGHHNGAGLPLPDRCTNCHISIHGTDTPTPTGGSRFVDKGPSEPQLLAAARQSPSFMRVHGVGSASVVAHPGTAGMPAFAPGAASAGMGMLASVALAPLSGGNLGDGQGGPTATEATGVSSFFSVTPAAYRFVHGSGFLGRVGEYDSLQESAGTDAVAAYVLPMKHLTLVSRANVLTGDDYTAAAQLTAGERLQVGLAIRSFEQQQDNYPFYAFPFLDVPPGTTTPCVPDSTCVDTTTDRIPSGKTFAMTRRLGNAYARFKVPRLPVHLFVKGDWNARAGVSQLSYLDENSFVTTTGATQFCGAQCHHISQFQAVNYTTRNIGGGADVKLGQILLRWEHYFSSFNDRLIFPAGTFTGGFNADPSSCEASPFGFAGPQCVSSSNPPPTGPAPGPVPALSTGTTYNIDIPSPSQSSTDTLSMNWTLSPQLIFNGQVSYTRLRNIYTQYPQNTFGSDETLNWHPFNRLRLTADYHQHNLLNDFTPYYSLYGNVSYHEHSEGLRTDYEFPKGFDAELYYKRSGITRSNAALWNDTRYNLLGSQIYSVDNTDLLKVVPSSFSNTAGLALRYHYGGLWSARAGYEWTGTHNPGFLIVPQSNNRTFANLWFTPTPKIVFSNDISIIVQNDFPEVPLLNTPGVAPLTAPGATTSFGLNIAGLPPTFQRRNRFYVETASANFNVLPDWHVGFGYSYQQNNLLTFMAFQNDNAPGYILDEPNVPYKQITQAYWGDSTYTVNRRVGLNFRVTYNSSRSGFRPDLNPADAAKLGNQYLISQGAFDPNGLFSAALGNLQFASTQISEVIVPQWICQGKGYYLFPHKFEGGLVVYYGSYRDYFNPNLNGVLRTFSIYIGRSW